MQNEYIDLPINIQDTPEYLLEKAEPYKPAEDSNDAASDVLKNLEILIKGTQQELHLFYEAAFPAMQKVHFSGDKMWPTPSSLEGIPRFYFRTVWYWVQAWSSSHLSIIHLKNGMERSKKSARRRKVLWLYRFIMGDIQLDLWAVVDSY